MNTCTQRHQNFKAKGMTVCPHCLKKLTKPQIGYDTTSYRFTKDNVFITEDQAKEAWQDVGSCDWSVKAYSVMSAQVMA